MNEQQGVGDVEPVASILVQHAHSSATAMIHNLSVISLDQISNAIFTQSGIKSMVISPCTRWISPKLIKLSQDLFTARNLFLIIFVLFVILDFVLNTQLFHKTKKLITTITGVATDTITTTIVTTPLIITIIIIIIIILKIKNTIMIIITSSK